MNIARQVMQQNTTIRVVEESGASRFLEITFKSLNKTINTPNYILTTKGYFTLRGAINGMTKCNSKNVEFPSISINFADMHSYRTTLKKYKQFLNEKNKDRNERINHLKRYLNFEEKIVMFTPYPYSQDKERVGGNNDEQFLQLNGQKVNVDEYYQMVLETQPDLVVAPCEQVTQTGGKKKRKRATKAAVKNYEQLQKILRESQSQTELLIPTILGDDEGLDCYEMRQFIKCILGNDDGSYLGFMIYGNDGNTSPAKYQEMLDFFVQMPKQKLRALHGTGSPIDVLNGILCGIDLFEGDYPLQQASQGIALQIRDFSLSKNKKSFKTSLELSKQLDTQEIKKLNLASKDNIKSKEPLVQKCMCYTCKNYNRAYLYHLLDVKEMNANILIGIHNLWVYERFFMQIRTSISNIHHYIEDFIEINCEQKK